VVLTEAARRTPSSDQGAVSPTAHEADKLTRATVGTARQIPPLRRAGRIIEFNTAAVTAALGRLT